MELSFLETQEGLEMFGFTLKEGWGGIGGLGLVASGKTQGPSSS
jgi:hypothetical protein